jgi:hypothetical protein
MTDYFHDLSNPPFIFYLFIPIQSCLTRAVYTVSLINQGSVYFQGAYMQVHIWIQTLH